MESMRPVLDDVLAQVSDPMTLLQLAVVVVALVLAWVLGRRWKARPGDGWRADIRQRLSLPFIVLAVVALAMLVLGLSGRPYPVLGMVAALSLSLVLIRAFLYLLRRVLRPGPVLEASEQLISGVIWLGVALYWWAGSARPSSCSIRLR